VRIVLPAAARALLEPHLPADAAVTWFATPAEAIEGIADAEVAWVDMQPPRLVADVLAAAGPSLRWVNTIYAGLDAFPVDRLRELGAVLTNGTGINAVAVAEYAVMGVLAAAKRLDLVVRAQGAREWLRHAPGRVELDGTRSLVIGYGTIGRMVGERLAAFGVDVTGVTRTGRDGTLGPNDWRARLGGFDWVVLAAPSTAGTRGMIGAAELEAMKPTAWLVNMARGDMVERGPLLAALREERIGGAFLDTVDPEPLPPDDPLWDAPNCILTMHLSGRSQTRMFERGAALFLENLAAWRAGRPLKNRADLTLGY